MSIVDMRIGDPVELEPSIRTVVFLLPTHGLGLGYATKLANDIPAASRSLGGTTTCVLGGRTFHGVVVIDHDGLYHDDVYASVPDMMRRFLARLDEKRSRRVPLAVVISGRDMPVNVRFEFMATLARSKQIIRLFDFPHS